MVHHIGQHKLQHIRGQGHVVLEVGKGDLRLNHPELRGMALGVGLLGAEGGAKGVHLAEGHGHALGLQLAGDGQAGWLAEEVLGEIHLAIRGLRNIV